MVAVAWQELKDLVWRPTEVFEGVLVGQHWALSLMLGMISYYVGTLQISELLLPRHLGGQAYFLLNVPLALGRMALLVLLLHLVARLFSHGTGRWRDLMALWGYTQLPHIALTIIAVAFFAIGASVSRMSSAILWGVLIGAIALICVLWGLILKLQALQTCYHLDVSRLLRVVGLACVLYVGCAWLERTFIYERGLVPQDALRSMAGEAVSAGDRWRKLALPFDRLTYHLRRPERGEVVGLVLPTTDAAATVLPGLRSRYLGRIVGLPGEQVEVKAGRVLIDDRPLGEPSGQWLPVAEMSTTTVPAGHFFILGHHGAVAPAGYAQSIVPLHAIRGRLTDVGRLKWRLVLGTWLW
jgi:signal peptidase I